MLPKSSPARSRPPAARGAPWAGAPATTIFSSRVP